MQVHEQLQIVPVVLQMHAQHSSYVPLGLLQIFFFLLVELQLFSQMLPTLDIFYQQGNIQCCSYCKVEFIQPSNWLYSVPNLLVIQHLVTLYLGGLDVRVVSEIE